MRGVASLFNDSVPDSAYVLSRPLIFKEPVRFLLTLVITLVIVFTVFGNFITLLAILKLRTLRKSISNLFIASLAAADLIVGGFVMTFMMIYTVANGNIWHFGPIFCDVWQVMDMSSCTTSLYSVVAITFDRWWHLEKPLRVFNRNRSLAKKFLVLIWVLPVVIWLPTFITLRYTNDDRQSSSAQAFTCSVDWKPKVLVPLLAVPVLYLPVLLLIVLFMRISFVIRTHLHFMSVHSNQKNCGNGTIKSNFILEYSIPAGLSEMDIPRKKFSLSANYNKSFGEAERLLALKNVRSYESLCNFESKENMSSQSTVTATTPRTLVRKVIEGREAVRCRMKKL